ncbi:MAG TPA: hypothetical protein VL485_04335 [Ktedonobacteraceae bacterium]|jgi:C4-dicarboxylate transporter/malic acid transport protein|nr:hypothetical protein [Ktedonobacteraceae bacterium]
MGEKYQPDTIKHFAQQQLKMLRILLHWFMISLHNINPSWFSCVMGTGILAICIILSPVDVPFIEGLATVLWIMDVFLLIALSSLWIVQSIRYPMRLQASLHHFANAQNWGTPPMACFTVASGFVVIGPQLFPLSFCVLCAQFLWLGGVAGSLFSAVAVPYLMFTHHELTTEHTYGNWLLPVVPLIGAAVPGALLTPYWPRILHQEMLVLNYVLWGIGIVLAAIVIVLFYSRLAYHKVPQGSLVTTFWMVIGPAGQSATAIMALGKAADEHLLLVGSILHKAGIAYGLVAWSFGMYWLVLAILVTLRAVRIHLPFHLGWWAFIYPVGTLTTGTYALHERVPTHLFMLGGIVLLLLLAGLWVLVSTNTVRHILQVMSKIPYGHAYACSSLE